MKKNVLEIANKLFKEMKDDNEIINAVLSDRFQNKQLLASISVNGVSFEVWKPKEGGKIEVIKSTVPPSDQDFKIRVSTKKVRNDVLIEIVASVVKAFCNEEECKDFVTELGKYDFKNKSDSQR